MLTSVLRPVFIASTIAWALLLLLAPFIAARPHPTPIEGGLLLGVYAIGSGICHQLAERSFFLWSEQMPVCARCAGIYFGAAIAALVATGLPRRSSGEDGRSGGGRFGAATRSRLLLLIAAAPAVLSLLYEWTAGQMPSHSVRAATGVPLGAMVAWMVMWATAPGRAQRIR